MTGFCQQPLQFGRVLDLEFTRSLWLPEQDEQQYSVVERYTTRAGSRLSRLVNFANQQDNVLTPVVLPVWDRLTR